MNDLRLRAPDGAIFDFFPSETFGPPGDPPSSGHPSGESPMDAGSSINWRLIILLILILLAIVLTIIYVNKTKHPELKSLIETR